MSSKTDLKREIEWLILSVGKDSTGHEKRRLFVAKMEGEWRRADPTETAARLEKELEKRGFVIRNDGFDSREVEIGEKSLWSQALNPWVGEDEREKGIASVYVSTDDKASKAEVLSEMIEVALTLGMAKKGLVAEFVWSEMGYDENMAEAIRAGEAFILEEATGRVQEKRVRAKL